MAEALGVVSGGFAVVSLALQLLDTAQKFHTFWESFGDAGSDVERIKRHLDTLRAIAATVAETCQQEPQIQDTKSVLRSLLSCNDRIEKLTHLTRNIGKDGRAGRWDKGWTILRATLKDKTIRKIESQLNGDVMILQLALLLFFDRTHQHDVKLINNNMKNLIAEHDRISDLSSSQTSSSIVISRPGRLSSSQLKRLYQCFKIDSFQTIESLLARLGVTLPSQWHNRLRCYIFSLTYTSATHQLFLDAEQTNISNVKRRLRIVLPIAAFQLQTATLPLSVTLNPIVPCQSQIFKLCLEGNIEMVKIWFKNSWSSPFVVNQHGENLLHIAARYARAELCNLLLDVGVDGTAYDDHLLTPLDHLARKVCLSFPCPSQVVNTIRALIERGHCQPLLPVTSNPLAFYKGPEEGFAWLFSSEYAGSDLEERDSEDWTLLGDAALNFGSWTQLGVDDLATSWQCLYLLRAGASPHSTSSKGRLTPLDAFLRGCTTHQVDHARKWLQILSQSGIDLYKYASEEQKLHHPEHFLTNSWDEELWRWIPTKRRVVYQLGDTPEQLAIWLEDYDALNWFCNGRFDLEIFLLLSPSESEARWQMINAVDDMIELDEQEVSQFRLHNLSAKLSVFQSVLSARWFQLLALSLALNYFFHVMLVGK